ncbi:MAG: mechanosensitive ion channel domain-containing protein [Myxococcota bacterium]
MFRPPLALAAAFATLFTALPSPVRAQTESEGALSVSRILETLNDEVAPWAAKIVGALLALFVGWVVAGWIARRIRKVVKRRDFDSTLGNFFANVVRYLILVAVVLGVLGVFGIQTSTFAAVIGAAGLAVGLAFEGTLSSFAAGAMLLIFRPFKVGDYIKAAGTEGFVVEIELFTTELKTLDSLKVIIPNSKIFGDTIVNLAGYPHRRVDVDIRATFAADIDATRRALESSIAEISGAVREPAPQIFLTKLGESSVDWQVRVFCPPAAYFDVYEETVRAAKQALDREGITIPFPQLDVHMEGAASA